MAMTWAWWTATIASAVVAAPPAMRSPRAAPGPRVVRAASPGDTAQDAEWNTPNGWVSPRRASDEEGEDGIRLPVGLRTHPAVRPVSAAALDDPPPPEPPTGGLPALPGAAKKNPPPTGGRLPALPAFPKPPAGKARPEPAAPISGRKTAPADPDALPDLDPPPRPEPPALKKLPAPEPIDGKKSKDLGPPPAPTGPLRSLPPLDKVPAKEPAAKEPEPDHGLQPIPSEKKAADAKKAEEPAPKKAAEEPPAKEPPKAAEDLPPEVAPNVNVRAWNFAPSQLRAMWPDDELREWSGSFRAMSVFRDQSKRGGLAASSGRSIGGGNLDGDGDGGWGGEFALQRRYDAVNALEIHGMAADRLHHRLETSANEAFALPALGPSAAAFSNLTQTRFDYSNRYLEGGLDWSQRFGGDLGTPWRLKLLGGPRVVNMSEGLTIDAASPTGAVRYAGRVQNALFGANAGAVASLLPASSPLALEVAGRAGAFGNVSNASQDLAAPGFSRGDRDGSAKFASLAQLDATADWRVVEGFHLFLGYRLQSFRGVLRALDQPTYQTDPAATFGVRGDGRLMVQSILAGFRLQWGGATDPDTRAGGMRPYLIESR